MCRFCEQAAFGQQIAYDPQLGRGGLVPGTNMPPDLILSGGTILTMDPIRPVVGAMAIREGIIQRLGGAEHMIAGRGRMTRIVDLEGKTVLPGFIASGVALPEERDTLSLDLWVSELVRSGFTAIDLVELGSGWADYDRLHQLLQRRHRLRLRGAAGPRLLAEWQAEPLTPGVGNDLIRIDTVRIPLSAGAEQALSAAQHHHEEGWAVLLADDTPPDSGMQAELLQLLVTRRLPGLRLVTSHGPDDALREAFGKLGVDIIRPDLPVTLPLTSERARTLTCDAAMRAGIDDICGSLRPGSYADFTILDRAPGMAGTTKVLATWLEGVPVRKEADNVAV